MYWNLVECTTAKAQCNMAVVGCSGLFFLVVIIAHIWEIHTNNLRWKCSICLKVSGFTAFSVYFKVLKQSKHRPTCMYIKLKNYIVI